MSLKGSATDTNLNVLRGKISKISPYALDTSLSVEGAGAEAKATGAAIERVEHSVDTHVKATNNPHKVSKAQIGLGNVDNTSDDDKPVSKAQTEALAKKVDKVSGKGLSTNDFTDEDKAKLDGIEAGANKYEYTLEPGSVTTETMANGNVTAEKIATGAVSRVYEATISKWWQGDEAPYYQEVTVEGLPASDRIFADLIVSEDFETAEAEVEEYSKIYRMTAEANKLTVYAKEPTTISLTLKLVVLHGSGLGTGGYAGAGGDTGGINAVSLVDQATGQNYVLYVKDGNLTLA